MVPGGTTGFALDRRLDAASRHVLWLGLCELRMVDDSRWPWLLLIPQRPGIREPDELTPLDQTMLTFEANLVAAALRKATGCETVNQATMSNEIEQLHVQLVARSRGDPGWPSPVWEAGPARPWPREKLHQFIDRLRMAI